MPRSLTPAAESALAADTVTRVAFVEIVLASGTLQITTCPHNLVWNSITWLGAGRVGSVDPIEEGAEQQMYGVRLSLAGLPAGIFGSVIGEKGRKQPVRIWEGLISGGAIVADPIGPFRYRLDTIDVVVGKTASITATAESPLADLDRPRVRRYNDADQRAEYPDDRFCEFVEELVEKELVWGRV